MYNMNYIQILYPYYEEARRMLISPQITLDDSWCLREGLEGLFTTNIAEFYYSRNMNTDSALSTQISVMAVWDQLVYLSTTLSNYTFIVQAKLMV